VRARLIDDGPASTFVGIVVPDRLVRRLENRLVRFETVAAIVLGRSGLLAGSDGARWDRPWTDRLGGGQHVGLNHRIGDTVNHRVDARAEEVLVVVCDDLGCDGGAPYAGVLTLGEGV
jgi:hypothetical protein